MVLFDLTSAFDAPDDNVITALTITTIEINEYLLFRKKNMLFDKNKFVKLVCDFDLITRYWVGHTYIGKRKKAILSLKYSKMFSSFMKLLLFLKENISTCSPAEKILVSDSLYTGPIYRYLGNGNYKNIKKINLVYDNLYCSWSKNKRNDYIESKLYGEYLIVTAKADEEQYGIDISKMGIGRPNEEEVIFPTLKEKIVNVEIFRKKR